MELEPILLLLLLFIGLPGLFVSQSLILRKRAGMFSDIATKLGFEKVSSGANLEIRLRGTMHFNRGVSSCIRNVIQGESGDLKVSVLDHHYSNSHGSNASTSRQTVVVIESDGCHLPNLRLYARKLYYDTTAKSVGLQEQTLDLQPGFERQYILWVDSLETARSTIPKSIQDQILDDESVYLESFEGMFVFHRYCWKSGDEVLTLIDDALKMRDRISQSQTSAD